MHTKAKGNVGELAVAKDLTLKGYNVFAELGDLSKIDLIAVKGRQLLRIQVKTCWDTSDGKICVTSKSSGPGYEYHYTSDDVDIIALYAADRDDIVYVDIKDVDGTSGKRGKVLRYTAPKNNQEKGVVLVADYKRTAIIGSVS